MLDLLKKEASKTQTLNGGLTYSTSLSHCLDLFFRAGAMRNADANEIADIVRCAYAEDSVRTMKILFFVRDIRGGLGERRFFRIAMQTLALEEPEAVLRNLAYIQEYGRYDDLCAFLHTPCEEAVISLIRNQLAADCESMKQGNTVSLLAKWLPSVNASARETKQNGRYIASRLGMSECKYRKTLSALRRYLDIVEKHLCESDYRFSYEGLPSGALFKYRKAFIRNDEQRYLNYLNAVENCNAIMHTSTLYPYEIIRKCSDYLETEERYALDLSWRNLPAYGESEENAIAVIDGSGSMTWAEENHARPIDVAQSLGIYFAEHNKGRFANHFITFSMHPKLVEIKGSDITEKAKFCSIFNEVANTNLEAVFQLILDTAMKNQLPQSELPAKLFIISDMEFDSCIEGGNSQPLYETMRDMYYDAGYQLPQVIFWNVNSVQSNIPVQFDTNGTALISGFSPALFNSVLSGEINPMSVMDNAILCERYADIS